MILKHNIESTFLNTASIFKIVTITGPRQAGKTTLCRKVFPGKKYYSLEDPDIGNWCESDPRSFLKEISEGAILDEIQRVPDFLANEMKIEKFIGYADDNDFEKKETRIVNFKNLLCRKNNLSF